MAAARSSSVVPPDKKCMVQVTAEQKRDLRPVTSCLNKVHQIYVRADELELCCLSKSTAYKPSQRIKLWSVKTEFEIERKTMLRVLALS